MVKLLALFTTVWALSSVRGVLEDEYQVQDVSSEERVGALIRHGRSRTHFVRYEHRGAPELVYMGPVAYENYDLPDVVSSEKEVDVIPTMSVIEEITSVTEQETTTPTTPAPVIIRHSKPVEHNHLQKYSEQKPKLSSNISEIMEILKKKGKASHEEVPAGKIKGGGEIEDDYFSLPNTDDDDEELVVVEEGQDLDTLDGTPEPKRGNVDIVTRFLTIVESQHLLGENCTAGTDLNLGEGVVDRYAQERFRVEADVAVNRANMLTRLWKYADSEVMNSEYLLHASVFSMVEFDEDIFAAGNCYDQYQYKDYWLFCPYAYRLPEGPILVKDLAVEYKYLSNTSEWFYIARKHAENVIRNYSQFSRGFNTYTYNETAHTERQPDEILSVKYEDGKWSKPYYDCGGGNIWMLTYTVPFFGFHNGSYFFKGTSGIDIDLRRVDIDQCPLPDDSTQLNIFAASDKCKNRTTQCVPIPGLGFRRGSYKCVCRRGFYFPDVKAEHRYYNGTVLEEEYEKLLMSVDNQYSELGMFECLQCAEGCESCEDDRPCVVSLNWVMRTAILILSCVIISCLPVVVLFTWKYGNVKVVRAASPVLLRVITLGAFFIYCTTIVMYPRPNIYTCTIRVWLREIGFSLTYGALMLKTWRISVIFRVRSAKAVKITDLDLLKRLGVIVTIFSVFLVIRTLVAPPHVIVGRTADDLKAFLCRTDWWDHSFTTLEVMFLVWGIRLCIVVRKAPSEFNESRFISMAIYNEFLLSVFLNVSMLFLQSPANPDLLYIIFFCHTQLTVTLLLCLIFGSKAYMVFKGHGKSEESSSVVPKPQAAKFLSKPRTANSQYVASTNSSTTGMQEYSKLSEMDVQEEFQRLYTQLEQLKEKNMRLGNRHLAAKITAMQEAAKQNYNDGAYVEELPSTEPAATNNNRDENLKLNNVLAVVTDKIVCATVSNDDVNAIGLMPLDTTNMTKSPPKSKCSSLVSSPDSDTPLRGTEHVSPVLNRTKVSNLSKSLSESETGGTVNSKEPLPTSGVKLVDLEMSSTCKKSTVGDSASHSRSKKRSNAGKSRNSGGKKHNVDGNTHSKYSDVTSDKQVESGQVKVDGYGEGVSSKPSHSQSSSEGASPNMGSNNRNLKSGHARTHAIVINLDDKNRFTEEVTV